MTFMAATMTPEGAAKKHLADLRESADAIAHGTQQLERAASSDTSAQGR
jgi:hypothetical protein